MTATPDPAAVEAMHSRLGTLLPAGPMNGHADGPAPVRRWRSWDPRTRAPGPWHGPRRDYPDGTKDIPWESGARPAELIYGGELLTGLSRDVSVVLTEGEKAADAVRDAGYHAFGTVCGASTTPDDVVLQLFRDRHVILWPDADDPGRKNMTAIAKGLERLGVRSLRWVEPPADATKGWDAADTDHATIGRLLGAAVELPLLPPEPARAAATPWPEPEDRGGAVLSDLGDVTYVEDMIRPGRILLVGAEEGTGKSMAIDGELGIRVACAGGSFAETWPIVRNGPVLVLSEMHSDDDFEREQMILAALQRERTDLSGKYWRLPLMTAAGGPPALTVAEWRTWITGWMRERGVLLLIVDTATGATLVDPWGKAIQQVYADLRGMVAEYPELAIVLIVHLKKPQGRGERRISDVLGEWGRWCDVVLMLEGDGATRTKLTTYKRIRTPRRVVATKRAGLLVEPIDPDAAAGTKVPLDDVVAAIVEHPGISYKALGEKLGVSKDTASNYVAQLGDRVDVAKTGPRGSAVVFATTEPPITTERAQIGGPSAMEATEPRTTAEPPNPMYRFGGRSSVVAPVPIPFPFDVDEVEIDGMRFEVES